MLSKRGLTLLAVSGILFTAGAIFGNIVFIAMSLPPFFLFFFGMLFAPPYHVTGDTSDIPQKLWKGQEFVFTRKIIIDGGAGAVKIFQKLPDEMELLEGNNLRVLWKWWGTETVEITCRLRCIKKGECAIPPLQWQTDNMLGMS